MNGENGQFGSQILLNGAHQGDLEVGIRNADWKISGYTPYTRVYPGLCK